MPFDWKTPFGYFVALLVQLIDGIIICHNCTCVLGLLIGFFALMIIFSNNIQKQIYELSERHKMYGIFSITRKEFRDVIVLHSKVKQLSFDTLKLN